MHAYIMAFLCDWKILSSSIEGTKKKFRRQFQTAQVSCLGIKTVLNIIILNCKILYTKLLVNHLKN